MESVTTEDLIKNVATILNISEDEARNHYNTLLDVLKDNLVNLDSVAIPGFGALQSIKKEEEIVENPTDGGIRLIPPSVELVFIPSVVIRKQLVG